MYTPYSNALVCMLALRLPHELGKIGFADKLFLALGFPVLAAGWKGNIQAEKQSLPSVLKHVSTKGAPVF